MRRFLLSFLCLGLCCPVWTQPRAPIRVWVDIDGAADDLRAICLLSALPHLEMVAVTTSEGALLPLDAARKVSGLLDEFGRREVPVGVGRELRIPEPRWRAQSENIRWAPESGHAPGTFPSAAEILPQALNDGRGPVTLLALGPLTNPADLLSRHPELAGAIERIVWYNGGAVDSGANYEADPESARSLFDSAVRLEIVTGESTPIPIDERYIGLLEQCTHPAAAKIVETHRQEILRPVVASGHMKAWDELAALYLFAPELFAPIACSPFPVYGLTGEQAVRQAVAAILRQWNKND